MSKIAIGYILRLPDGRLFRATHAPTATIYKTLKGAAHKLTYLRCQKFGSRDAKICELFYDDEGVGVG